jgi:hypothetical protein
MKSFYLPMASTFSVLPVEQAALETAKRMALIRNLRWFLKISSRNDKLWELYGGLE